MLSCRTPEKLGYYEYACPEHPDQYVVISHSCKSRFCSSCGKVLTDKWVKKINSLFPNVSFHHLCFTLPQELRKLLKEYRFLLNGDVALNVLLSNAVYMDSSGGFHSVSLPG